jgi:hypothetical protein
MVEWTDDGFVNVEEAGYNDAMTIFDVLCCSREGCRLSGKFVPVNELPGIVAGSRAGNGLFQEFAEIFDADTDGLCMACEKLGGTPVAHGDVGYEIPFVGNYRVRIFIWTGDEEFPPSAKILYSDNFAEGFTAEDRAVAADLLISTIKANM